MTKSRLCGNSYPNRLSLVHKFLFCSEIYTLHPTGLELKHQRKTFLSTPVQSHFTKNISQFDKKSKMYEDGKHSTANREKA